MDDRTGRLSAIQPQCPRPSPPYSESSSSRGLSLADSIAAALEGRSRLLVFDNCEHVLDAAADLIEAILSRSSTVKVLATSREGLRLADEQLWPVPSLDVLTETELAAATLFVDRAQAVASDHLAVQIRRC